MKFAPETPTAEELHDMFEFTPELEERRDYHRNLVTKTMSGRGFIDIQGPCALTAEEEVIDATLERMCVWKPRTLPTSWFGMETTDPVGAFARIDKQAKLRGNVAMELGRLEHVVRYGSRIALGWLGSRLEDEDEKEEIALEDPAIPLGEKNPLSGEVEPALITVDRLNAARGDAGAPVFLVFRGGEAAKTPEAWEKLYIEAYTATNGLMVVDAAHGSEMAHDPAGEFQKSAIAQERALRHIAELATSGYAPAAVLCEASNLESPVDPPVSPDIAKQYVTIIKRARIRQITAPIRATDSTPYFA